MSEDESTVDLSWRERAIALYRVVKYRPVKITSILLLSMFTAVLEGFGVAFILPVIDLAQSGTAETASGGRILELFVGAYQFFGVPFTLLNVIVGTALVMSVRYSLSFLIDWIRALVTVEYVTYLQDEAFERSLNARIAYFDREGSDEILNAIVTQAEYAGQVIQTAINLIEQVLLSLIYLSIALYLSPELTLGAGIVLGGLTLLVRGVVEDAYDIGDSVADAKEEIQTSAQAGTQGIHEVKLFGLRSEIYSQFQDSISKFKAGQVRIQRTRSGIDNFYQLMTSIVIFVLIYLALTVFPLSLGSMAVFLFAMFRLGPRVSNMNGMVYNFEGQLPHLVRTQEFISKLEDHQEEEEADRDSRADLPDRAEHLSFEDVEFGYEGADETALEGVSFTLERGELIAFVGPSGAGKSTIVSLITRMYDPDAGRITADDVDIDQFDLDEWREHISVVRQDPHLFNETLRRNVTIGNRDASQEEIERICEIAKVTEFLDDLPDGYDTVLGDDGVKLSGGQRQRVAIARALLKDADFVLLDEATSDLDSLLEKQVHEGIEQTDRDVGLLIIAHRLSTVTNADRIHTVEDGRIVETGDHTELIEADSEYANLYALQSS